jgi:hypothetical protein
LPNEPTSAQLFQNHVSELQTRILASVPPLCYADVDHILALLTAKLPQFRGSPARFQKWIGLSCDREIKRFMLFHEFDKLRRMLEAAISRSVGTADPVVIDAIIQDTRVKLLEKSDGFIRPKNAKARFSTRIWKLTQWECRKYLLYQKRQCNKYVSLDDLLALEQKSSESYETASRCCS